MIDNEVIRLGKKRRNFIQNSMEVMEGGGTQRPSTTNRHSNSHGKLRKDVPFVATSIEEIAKVRGFYVLNANLK